jgi:hopanoid C-3 methylase HpnR
MKFLCVYPSPLHYFKNYYRLEPIGLELVAAAACQAGHRVQIVDLQVESHKDYFKRLHKWKPDAVGLSCNYLPNVPEIIDLAKATKEKLTNSFIFVGGHSASFIARELLEHGEGAIDCILKGEGEASVAQLLEAVEHDRRSVTTVPGAATLGGEGPPPVFVKNLDDSRPARHLLRHRRKYYVGVLDPCASIEFSRGCPWDCVFCSAWTFYGRSYRAKTPESIVEELEQIREPGIFVVDDLAFLQSEHGFAVGEAIAKKGIKKRYYLETRGDILLRNKEVFEFWRRLGLKYIFLGLEAIDAEGLEKYRKRVTLSKNFEALECARSLGVEVAVNIIADPDWGRDRFETIRQWCLEVPEFVTISVKTPYPGTEIWHREPRQLITRDYRLFDIYHAVLPTKLPLRKFYEELAKTQQVLQEKHLSWAAVGSAAKLSVRYLLEGQTNFVRMLWKARFDKIHKSDRYLSDHQQSVKYKLTLPPEPTAKLDRRKLYVYPPQGRRGRAIDDATEDFVDATRTGSSG